MTSILKRDTEVSRPPGFDVGSIVHKRCASVADFAQYLGTSDASNWQVDVVGSI